MPFPPIKGVGSHSTPGQDRHWTGGITEALQGYIDKAFMPQYRGSQIWVSTPDAGSGRLI